MGIRKYKPTSPGRRNASVLTNEEITKKSPEKALLEPKNKKGGRAAAAAAAPAATATATATVSRRVRAVHTYLHSTLPRFYSVFKGRFETNCQL